MRLGRRKDGPADPDRRALIELCLYARDRVSSAAADRIDAGLAELGVRAVRPDGEAFDPARHEAASTVPTTDPELHDTVAETELPGYSDRGEVIRVPVVAVYRLETESDEEPAG
ncbi:MAG TPA: nucleotide exchange factor GrpE [Mycobacteriales bacterium]|nr:nucleotide exchange factor GrpE [Mycobacteriales bacterium]